jgi:hypothetical protein
MIQPLDYNDAVEAYRITSEVADRFRDLLCEVLELDSNPGDDKLVAMLRAKFNKTGPESTVWRERSAGYEALIERLRKG